MSLVYLRHRTRKRKPLQVADSLADRATICKYVVTPWRAKELRLPRDWEVYRPEVPLFPDMVGERICLWCRYELRTRIGLEPQRDKKFS